MLVSTSIDVKDIDEGDHIFVWGIEIVFFLFPYLPTHFLLIHLSENVNFGLISSSYITTPNTVTSNPIAPAMISDKMLYSLTHSISNTL